MPFDPKDMGRLWDMLDSARTAVLYTRGLRYEEFLNQGMTRDAVERKLEIIGEAARRVSQEARDQLQDIPWKQIIGLRNILAHEYGEIRYEILWIIICDKLGPLIQRLENTGIDTPPPIEEG